MPLEPKELSRIIFGPVSVADESYGDRIYQPLSHDKQVNPELDERACVIITDFVATELMLAASDEECNGGFLRELGECATGSRRQISAQYNRDLTMLRACGYVDGEGRFGEEALKALKFALVGTGISELPEFQKIVCHFKSSP